MSQYQSNPGYDVDIVLCIDGTASMSPIMDRIKNMAMQFPAMYGQAMREGQKTPRSLHVKVIVFRDFLKNDGTYDDTPFEDSGEFFDLMSDDGQNAFERYVRGIEPRDGGDLPENSLEAIALALRSHWISTGTSRRQAILLFTDAEPLPLEDDSKRKQHPAYPKGMPADLDALQRMYEYGDQEYAPYYRPRYGRLVVFAPKSAKSTWSTIDSWERAWVVPTTPEGGCEDVDLKEAFTMLVGTF